MPNVSVGTKPPQAFVEIYLSIYPDRLFPRDPKVWKALAEWQAFKAGYNACAEKHNQNLLNQYSINANH